MRFMFDFPDRIAIIGAGPVGLGAARALRDHDIPYDQFEADDDIGGNWYHGVYSTTHTISSRRVTQYPEFPMPASYPDYPSRAQVIAYLREYARVFRLREKIVFNAKVVMARPLAARSWEITLASGETRTYKGLIVANGHDWSRKFPQYPGKFTGEFIHSKDYKRPEQLAGRRVLVIGSGNSACDIACEAARVGASSDVSMRSGYWFEPKVLFGRPFHEAFPLSTPVWLHRILLKTALRLTVGDYRHYGLQRPTHKLFDRVATINTELLDYLRHGRVTPRPAVASFDGDRVAFADGKVASFDMIVCATGFHLDFPFLPKGMVPVNNGVAPLYGGVLPLEYRHLYIAAATHPIYGFGPIISAGADLVALMIRLQDRIELPLGRVLKACGMRPVKTHLLHPGVALREMRWARRVLPILVPMVEPMLRRKAPTQPAVSVPDSQSAALNREMTVY